MKDIKSTIWSTCTHDPMPPNGKHSKFLGIAEEIGITKYRIYLSKDPSVQFRECALLHKGNSNAMNILDKRSVTLSTVLFASPKLLVINWNTHLGGSHHCL